ncbi:Pentatricopeptide repeat-containing protein, mitochondrial, partial [Cucurbita argyrosperma subsp. sororia]
MEKIFFLVGSCNTLIHKCGFHGDVFVGNALITMYSRWEHLVDARQVFDEMRSWDWVSWSALITGYAQEGDHGRNRVVDMGGRVFDMMIKDHRIEAAAEQQSCMVDMVGRAGGLEEGEEMVYQEGREYVHYRACLEHVGYMGMWRSAPCCD